MDKNTLYQIYLSELLEWNQKFNLTSITDPAAIQIKHFEDSLTILKVVDLKDQRVVDVGSGAGFPGIPLKIERPEIKLTLVEATCKKINFLKALVKKLGLTDIEIIWDRAEKINQDPKYKGKFDLALARAVAKLDKLVGYCLPFLKPGGIFIAQKGPGVDAEIADAQKNLGIKIKEIKKLTLSNGDQRSLVLIKK
ncbi:MAG: 16S rRNA (guanine(527)-N(7))-methyltransferase RsmG [Candidatus Margulisbacteria bacterium]|nr:16S rRNA (guanine(527)-N(7))-methyltransferase RsmG [Candidatus Margulisiibacteriota bacterium]MBU1021762.1 16S rRNA (guanine(527)-N(7))-methyltransferase RsmG [Candidatus Margulisiibacteriota bacterium]MBU1729508.1 16S rRNA (guanine(527)-N(7))-methyltransferase RsmG [Candidatus Margulisiibacteriota bacterium]MBU1955391.1 16S rRNA (guanine(527)-N(7))-methyltransferase RsmG [Candidatus Margulisiibacteriota bacterium]